MRATLWAWDCDLSTHMESYRNTASMYIDVGGCCKCLLVVRSTCHELADGRQDGADVQTRYDTTQRGLDSEVNTPAATGRLLGGRILVVYEYVLKDLMMEARADVHGPPWRCTRLKWEMREWASYG